MAAVSLSEAWNEPSDEAPVGVARHISAKTVSVHAPIVEPDETDAPIAPALIAETNDRFEALLHEFRMLRLEESRRCTVYLAVGGILFAILFMYIDRLQRQIHALSNATEPVYVGSARESVHHHHHPAARTRTAHEPVYAGAYHPLVNTLPAAYTPVAPAPPGTSFRTLRRW